MTRKKIKLDAYEQEIEDNLHKMKRIKNFKAFKKSVEVAAKKHVEKRESLIIELSNSDIAKIQAKASQIGIPYQAYISDLIHRDAVSKQ